MRRLVLWMMVVAAGITVSSGVCRGTGHDSEESAGGAVDDIEPPESKYAEVNGIRIHYLEWGTGTHPVVLLHGMNGDSRIWTKMAQFLASDCRIVAPDRRGTGRSDKPIEGYDFQTLNRDLAHLIGSLDLGAVTLVGHSFGAEIALTTAARYPELTFCGSGRRWFLAEDAASSRRC